MPPLRDVMSSYISLRNLAPVGLSVWLGSECCRGWLQYRFSFQKYTADWLGVIMAPLLVLNTALSKLLGAFGARFCGVGVLLMTSNEWQELIQSEPSR